MMEGGGMLELATRSRWTSATETGGGGARCCEACDGAHSKRTGEVHLLRVSTARRVAWGTGEILACSVWEECTEEPGTWARATLTTERGPCTR